MTERAGSFRIWEAPGGKGIMRQMENRKSFYSANRFRVCIDSYREDISGRVYSPLCEEEIAFQGIGELLLKMDRLFDRMGYPQAFQNKRSFEHKTETENLYRGIPQTVQDTESIRRQAGRHYTCDIEVESRRNTSWQGEILAVDGSALGKFDGEVELLEKLTELTEKEV